MVVKFSPGVKVYANQMVLRRDGQSRFNGYQTLITGRSLQSGINCVHGFYAADLQKRRGGLGL